MCDFPWVFCKKLDFVTFPVFLFTWSLNVFFIFFCMAAIADYAAFAAIVDETTWSGLLEVFMICAMVTAFIGGGLVLGFERLTKKAYLSLYNNGHCRLVTTIATPALIFFIFFSFAVLSMLPDVGDSTVTESASVSKLLKTAGANASVGSTLDFHSASNVLSYYSPKALVNRAVYTVLAAIYDAPTDDGTLSDITSIDGDASVDVSATTATVGGDLVSTTTDGITNTLDAASEGGSPSSFSLLALGEELVNDSFTHTSLVDKKSFGFSMLILSLITLMYALLFRIWFHQFRKAKIELDYVMNPDEGKHLRADESSVQQGGRHREGGSDRYRRVKRRYRQRNERTDGGMSVSSSGSRQREYRHRDRRNRRERDRHSRRNTMRAPSPDSSSHRHSAAESNHGSLYAHDAHSRDARQHGSPLNHQSDPLTIASDANAVSNSSDNRPPASSASNDGNNGTSNNGTSSPDRHPDSGGATDSMSDARNLKGGGGGGGGGGIGISTSNSVHLGMGVEVEVGVDQYTHAQAYGQYDDGDYFEYSRNIDHNQEVASINNKVTFNSLTDDVFYSGQPYPETTHNVNRDLYSSQHHNSTSHPAFLQKSEHHHSHAQSTVNVHNNNNNNNNNNGTSEINGSNINSTHIRYDKENMYTHQGPHHDGQYESDVRAQDLLHGNGDGHGYEQGNNYSVGHYDYDDGQYYANASFGYDSSYTDSRYSHQYDMA